MPSQKAEALEFETYPDRKAMMAALRELFPEGADKASVETKLVEEGGATPGAPGHRGRPNKLYYHWKGFVPQHDKEMAWSIAVLYYGDATVRQVWVTGHPVHPLRPPDDRTAAEVFAFYDYDSGDELLKTLNILFPPGTPKSEVDKVLVRWAVASILPDPTKPNRFDYVHRGAEKPIKIFTVSVTYHPNDTVDSIIVSDQRCSGGSPSETPRSFEEWFQMYGGGDIRKC